VCDYRRGMDWILDLTHLYTPLGTANNCSAIANLHTLQIITASIEPFSGLMCLQQLFPSNGFQQCRFFGFPCSRRYCPSNIPQLNSLTTANSIIGPPLKSSAELTHQLTTSFHFTSLHSTELHSVGLGSSLYSLGADTREHIVLLSLRACSFPRERVYQTVA
jgi:hypothetical protein